MEARVRGQEIIVVSSGAVALGAASLGLPSGGRGSLADKQAAAALTPSSQQASEYAKEVYEIATQTNAGIVAVFQKHAMTFGPQAAMQSMTAAAQGATESAGANNPFVAALTNPFGAAQKAFKQAVDTTTASAAAVAGQPQASAA